MWGRGVGIVAVLTVAKLTLAKREAGEMHVKWWHWGGERVTGHQLLGLLVLKMSGQAIPGESIPH